MRVSPRPAFTRSSCATFRGRDSTFRPVCRASPRACLGLFQASKALAWLRGRDYVTPELVQEVFPDVMRHRVGVTYEAESRGLTADQILAQIVKKTPVPESA
jgi:MoxR-like ATPase